MKNLHKYTVVALQVKFGHPKQVLKKMSKKDLLSCISVSVYQDKLCSISNKVRTRYELAKAIYKEIQRRKKDGVQL